jgi:hypothetical protein
MFAVAQSGGLGACCSGDWLILTDWLFFSIRDILLIAYIIETICSGHLSLKPRSGRTSWPRGKLKSAKKSAAGLKASAHC